MRKIIISILFGLIFSTLLISYADETQKGIASGVVRLHIVADSDDAIAQNVKIKVRDAIITELGPVLSGAKSKDDANKIIKNNLSRVEEIAQKVLARNGFNYPAKAMYTKSHFPTKKYANIMLPPGEYDALKVVLGNGDGQNWWCVMYPPLCFEASNSGTINNENANVLRQNIGDDAYEIITESNEMPVKFKFKILELFDAYFDENKK